MLSEIVCIIPARGGSKAIPRKNLLDFCGKPLLAWSILQAVNARRVADVYVTSDDAEILAAAAAHGAKGIVRPPELATDEASSEAALLHALDVIEKERGRAVELVVFLQATSPLRESSDIDAAVGQLEREGLDALFSGCELEDYCLWQKTAQGLTGLGYDPFARRRRQEREPLILENGSIYLFTPGVLRGGNRLGGRFSCFLMPFWKSYEIDGPEDVAVCEFFFRKNGLAGEGPRLLPKDLDLVVYDFDGVMTDNAVLVGQSGEEAVRVTRADGLGVSMIRKMGIPQIILSTETNPVVSARAGKLGLEAITGVGDKRAVLREHLRQRGIACDRTLFVGNDLNDLDAMRMVGYPIAPADAHPLVLESACLVTRAKGGQGVVRELADWLSNASSSEKQ